MLKILSFHTPTHDYLFDEFFFKSIKDDCALKSEKGNQISADGGYYSKGFNETMKNKIEAVRNNLLSIPKGDFILYSDVDVIFIKPIANYLEDYMNYDMVFQKGYSGLNAGFFIAKHNDNVIQFLDAVINQCHLYFDDQFTINSIIGSYPISYSTFDDKVLSIAALNGAQIWDGLDINFNFPDDIVAFHACWCVGIEAKTKLLEYVRNFYEKIVV
jgi:hypothetical protein